MLQKDNDLQVHCIIKEKIFKLVGVKCFFFFSSFSSQGSENFWQTEKVRKFITTWYSQDSR